VLLFNTTHDSFCVKYAVSVFKRETEATQKPTVNSASMVPNQRRVVLV